MTRHVSLELRLRWSHTVDDRNPAVLSSGFKPAAAVPVAKDAFTQRLQNPLIKEYTSNYNWNPNKT